jgi:hypothetical protein
MADKYPSLTPYNYCANNPVILVDPNGEEVYVIGDAAEGVASKISTKNITVIRDEKTGKLSYEGKAKNRDERLLVKAINDDKVTVNLTVNKSDIVGKNDDGKDLLTHGGSFMGNTLSYDENGKAVSASANQYVSTNALTKNFNAEDHGAVITHEITEAHQGGLISIKTGVAAPMAIGDADRTIYDAAHERASYQPLTKAQQQMSRTPQQQAIRNAIKNTFNNSFRRY